MKPVSVHFPEAAYLEMKSLAALRGRPVAELIRQAMEEYLERERSRTGSILDRQPHQSGKLRDAWIRTEVLEEMLER